MRHIFLIFCLSILTNVFSQEAEQYRKLIGTDNANQQCNSALMSADSFFYIVGSDDNNSYGKDNFFLGKVNYDGDTLWTQNWGGVNVSDYLKCIIETSDNSLVMLGKQKSRTTNNTSNDLYVSKNSKENGEIIWFNQYGGSEDEIPESIIQTTDNGFVILATIRAKTGNQTILIKLDSQGKRLWTKSLNNLGNIKGSKLINLSGNKFAFIGTISLYDGGDTDIIFIKFDNNGEQLLKQNYGDKYNERPLDIFPLVDNGFIISGKVSSLDPYDLGYNAFFLKIDSIGVQEWYKVWNEIEGNSVIQTTDGNIVAGCSYKNKGVYNAAVVKLSIKDGSKIWTKLLGQENWDSNVSSIMELPDKSIVVFGDTRTRFYYILMCRIKNDGTWFVGNKSN